MPVLPLPPRLFPASDHAILVEFGREMSPANGALVRRLVAALGRSPVEGVLNVHPAYASVLVRFDARRTRGEAVRRALEALVASLDDADLPGPRTVTVPVHYGGEHGPDLPDVARHCGLAEEEVVRRHAAGEYEVSFLGFTPGFPYLAGLPATLSVPRLATPRTRVPAGSVAIGGSQAGIYPLDSPGGWRLIGWTPLRVFDPARDPISLLAIGDRVRFVEAPAGLRGGA